MRASLVTLINVAELKEERSMGILVHRRVVVLALAVALGLTMILVGTRTTSAKPSSSEEPNPFTVRGACDFPVLFEPSGRLNIIELPDGRTIVTAPGTTVTLTNLEEPDNQIRVVVTAAEHLTPQPDGTTLDVITGQILTWPPLELLVGKHTLLLNKQGKVIEMLSSEGQEIDVCALLA
jgi:hypothetical protein